MSSKLDDNAPGSEITGKAKLKSPLMSPAGVAIKVNPRRRRTAGPTSQDDGWGAVLVWKMGDGLRKSFQPEKREEVDRSDDLSGSLILAVMSII